MQEVQTHLPIGSILRDRYVIETLLGQGGFGAVYRVRDQRVKGNVFALKEVIEPQRKDRSRKEKNRFQFEGDILKQLDHRALPRVYRVFEDDAHERAYMLMDYVDGPNLEVLRQQQPEKRFPLSQVLILLEPVADALAYLHHQQAPIIHRDVKPSNIIVPAPQEAVLVDFDIAKEFDPDSTTTAVRRCSPGYGAPEQYGQGTSTLTDVYGLGATIYTLLTGQVPPDALHRMTMLGAKGSDPLVPLNQLVPEIPQRVANAVQKAMSLHKVDRYPTVEQFWHEVDANATSLEVPALAQTVSAQKSATPSGSISDEPTDPTDKKQLPLTPLPLVADIPTSSPSTVVVRKKRKRLALLLVLLALIVILGSAAGFVSALWHPEQTLTTTSTPTSGSQATPIVTISPISDSTATARPTGVTGKAVPTPTPTLSAYPPTTPVTNPTSIATRPVHYPTPTPAPAPLPTPTPTPIPNPYPMLAGTYSGTIVDTTPSPNISANMYLSSLRQNRGSISGYFTVDSPLQGNGAFTGTVGTNKYIQFTVQGYNGHAPLYFWGFVQSNSTLQGQYCSLDTSGHCSANVGAGGYWNVGPGSPGS